LFGIIAGLVAFFINFNAAWFGVDTREIGRWLLANPWQTLDLNWKDFVIYNLGQTWLITSLTALATIVGMALGNRLVADNEARRQQIAELFHRLERPEEAVIAERAQKLKEVTFTPFPIIAYVFGGFALIFLLLQWTATAGATGRDRTIGTITGVCMLLVAVGIYLLQFLVVRPRREPPASQ